METTRTLGAIRRRNGIGGQYAYDVTVTYDFGGYRGNRGQWVEPSRQVTRVSFVGSIYGSPVVMVATTADGAELWQTAVDNWRQYGAELNPAWIRTFYSA